MVYDIGEQTQEVYFILTQTPLCEHDETLSISLIDGATLIQYD